MEVAQLNREVSVVGGVACVLTTLRERSVSHTEEYGRAQNRLDMRSAIGHVTQENGTNLVVVHEAITNNHGRNHKDRVDGVSMLAYNSHGNISVPSWRSTSLDVMLRFRSVRRSRSGRFLVGRQRRCHAFSGRPDFRFNWKENFLSRLRAGGGEMHIPPKLGLELPRVPNKRRYGPAYQ